MAVTMTATDIEVYSGSVDAAYRLGDFFGNNKMKYFGMRPGELLNQPVVRRGDAKNLDDGADHTNEDSSFLGTEIPLELAIKASNTVKKRQVDERPDLNILQNLGEAHGVNVAEGKTIRLLNAISKTADAAGNIVFTAVAPTGTDMKNAIKEVMANMDELRVPATGRTGFIKSTEWYELGDADAVISSDFGGMANRQTQGGNMMGLNYLNAMHHNVGFGFGKDWTASSETALALPTSMAFDMTDVIGVIWHRDQWALREQTSLESTIDWIPEKRIWLVLSALQLGYAAIDGKGGVGESAHPGIWIIKNGTG